MGDRAPRALTLALTSHQKSNALIKVEFGTHAELMMVAPGQTNLVALYEPEEKSALVITLLGQSPAELRLAWAEIAGLNEVRVRVANNTLERMAN